MISETDVQTESEHQYADYSSLTVRHLGSIYEGLLEYELDVANEPLVAVEEEDSEEWITKADADDDSTVQDTVDKGEVYFKTTRKEDDVFRSYKPVGNERRKFGSYYTPEYVVKYIVEDSLAPVLDDIKEEARASAPDDEYAHRVTKRVFDLSILDPAMGSGHFLTGVVDYLASEILGARERQGDMEGVDSPSGEVDSEGVRRRVAQRCIYGIDVQPMAVELAKVSLWLNTLASERPLAFLDHHLKHGNSLIGSDLEDIEELPIEMDDDQTSLGDWGTTHQEAVEHAIQLSQDLLDIEMEDRSRVKEMEEKYQEIQDDDTYQRILAICDVYTARRLGATVRSGQIENLARAIDDDEKWADLKSEPWYEAVETLRSEHGFFHWHLEFPQVFYGGEDDELGRPSGFDVVLGNPPYGSVDDAVEKYLAEKYRDTAEYFIDSFALFIEKGLSLLQDDGQFGYIIPQQWLTQPNAEGLRQYVLTNSWVRTIIRFEERVFEGVDVDTIITMAEKTNETEDVTAYMADNSGEEIPELELVRTLDQDALLEGDEYRIEIRGTPEEHAVLNKIRTASFELQPKVGNVRIGIQAYNKTKHDKTTRKNRSFHSNTKASDEHYLEVKGRHVDRYRFDPSDAEYLKVGDHLHDPIPLRLCSGPRVLLQEITNESRHMLNAVYTETDCCFDKSVLGIVSTSNYDTRFILAVLNSEVISWIFPRISSKIISSFVTGSFPRIQVGDARKLPIPQIDFDDPVGLREDILMDILKAYTRSLQHSGVGNPRTELRGAIRAGHTAVAHDAISEFAGSLMKWYEKKNRLNTNLLSYITPYDIEGTLEEVAQPVSGVEDTVLAKTGVDPTYRIIEFELKPGHKETDLVVSVIDEETGKEKSVRAFTWFDLSEVQRRFLEAYLMAVLERSSEKKHSGFLPYTTKRNSLLDRLRALEIAEFDDIKTGAKQYFAEADEEAKVSRWITTTEALIDDAIPALYGLSAEERAVIESGLQEQE